MSRRLAVVFMVRMTIVCCCVPCGYGHTTKQAPDPIPHSEVKLRRAEIVLRWETTREASVLYPFCVGLGCSCFCFFVVDVDVDVDVYTDGDVDRLPRIMIGWWRRRSSTFSTSREKSRISLSNPESFSTKGASCMMVRSDVPCDSSCNAELIKSKVSLK